VINHYSELDKRDEYCCNRQHYKEGDESNDVSRC
jgi:hypothetical protein